LHSRINATASGDRIAVWCSFGCQARRYCDDCCRNQARTHAAAGGRSAQASVERLQINKMGASKNQAENRKVGNFGVSLKFTTFQEMIAIFPTSFGLFLLPRL
jgi:hypothetical protein